MPATTLSVFLQNLLNSPIVDPKTGAMTWQWRQFFIGLAGPSSHTITLAKLTGPGVEGFISFNEYGIVTEYQNPT